MSFRFDGFIEDFDGSNPGTPANSHKLVITAPMGERILWAQVNGLEQAIGSNDFSHIWLEPSSIHVDGNNEIDEVEFVLPDDSGERGVNVMYYTI